MHLKVASCLERNASFRCPKEGRHGICYRHNGRLLSQSIVASRLHQLPFTTFYMFCTQMLVPRATSTCEWGVMGPACSDSGPCLIIVNWSAVVHKISHLLHLDLLTHMVRPQVVCDGPSAQWQRAACGPSSNQRLECPAGRTQALGAIPSRHTHTSLHDFHTNHAGAGFGRWLAVVFPGVFACADALQLLWVEGVFAIY